MLDLLRMGWTFIYRKLSLARSWVWAILRVSSISCNELAVNLR